MTVWICMWTLCFLATDLSWAASEEREHPHIIPAPLQPAWAVLQTPRGKRQIPAGIFSGCEKDQGTGTKCRVRLLGCTEGEMSVPDGGTHSPGCQPQPWGTKPT